MANQGGSLFGFKKEVKNQEHGKMNDSDDIDDDYYLISTLYALGSVLTYHRIMIFEGIYSIIEDMYPTFGTSLIRKFENLGRDLDAITIETPNSSEMVSFFRYERMALGDAITENQEGHLKISSYLNFKIKYKTDHQMKKALEPARIFVEKLPNAPSDLDSLKMILKQILDQLKSKTDMT